MLHYDLRELAPGDRYKLFAGVIVPRPIAWITSLNPDGTVNAAPFSYFGALGSEPPLVALGFGRQTDGSHKHTAQNITSGSHFVINLVSESLLDAMNLTAADFPPGVDEVALAGLTLEASHHGPTPRIAQSPASLECREHTTLSIGQNHVVLAEVLGLVIQDDLMLDPQRHYVDTQALRLMGRMGGRGGYARAQDTLELPRVTYAEWLAVQDQPDKHDQP